MRVKCCSSRWIQPSCPYAADLCTFCGVQSLNLALSQQQQPGRGTDQPWGQAQRPACPCPAAAPHRPLPCSGGCIQAAGRQHGTSLSSAGQPACCTADSAAAGQLCAASAPSQTLKCTLGGADAAVMLHARDSATALSVVRTSPSTAIPCSEDPA